MEADGADMRLVKKRGMKEMAGKLFLLFAAIFVFMLAAQEAEATHAMGACLSDNAVFTSKICTYTSIEECCGTNPDAQGHDYCISSFRNTTAYPTLNSQSQVNALPECAIGQGCCSDLPAGSSCQIYDRKAQCTEDGGTFHLGEACSSVPQCTQGCCVWESSGATPDNRCGYMSYSSCLDWNLTSSDIL